MAKAQIIDASDRILGRLASDIALILREKKSPGYQPRYMPQTTVIVKNIDKIKLTGKKAEQKVYIHHTGFPGGLKKVSYKEMIKKGPGRALKLAVLGMLPKNRQRAKIIKHLIIE